MKLYLRRDSGRQELFCAYGEAGELLYTVRAADLQLGALISILNTDLVPLAQIRRIGLREVCNCMVSLEGRSGFQVILNTASQTRPLRIHGRDWRMRGSLETRSFDLIDSHSLLVLSHSPIYGTAGSYALMIPEAENTLAALCVAVAVDSMESCGGPVPVPV